MAPGGCFHNAKVEKWMFCRVFPPFFPVSHKSAMLQIVGTWYLQNLDPLKQTAGSHKIDGLGRCFSFSSRGYFQVNQPFVLRGVECEVMAAMLLNC